MKRKKEWWKAGLLGAVLLFCLLLPVERFAGGGILPGFLTEALHLVREYAREHLLLCLVPAFFIAGAVTVFLSQGAVMKYLGAKANRVLAYGVASVSGTILAVCSCTVLPLFAGICRMGAGIGPATAFLYAGPAVNILAVILTARVLGLELGIARAVGAVLFSVVIGLTMHFLFRKEEAEKAEAQAAMPDAGPSRPLWQNLFFFGLMIGVLVFANWGNPEGPDGILQTIHSVKWIVTGLLAMGLAAFLVLVLKIDRFRIFLVVATTSLLALFFHPFPAVPFAAAVIGLSWATASDPGEGGAWFSQTWGFARQILPLLLVGVLVAGGLLGRPGHEGVIPSSWVNGAVGGNSLSANFIASLAGAFMYFATLTEVPILQGLIGAGMGKGPALALLLAGPALSLPNMLVIRSVMGTKKTVAFVLLVVLMAMTTGMIYGNLVSPGDPS